MLNQAAAYDELADISVESNDKSLAAVTKNLSKVAAGDDSTGTELWEGVLRLVTVAEKISVAGS